MELEISVPPLIKIRHAVFIGYYFPWTYFFIRKGVAWQGSHPPMGNAFLNAQSNHFANSIWQK